MGLRRYLRKRDFSKTPEPRNSDNAHPKSRDGARYVIQKHAASRLHFDFRLELDGALKSWAVPKGLSMNPADKRLAVQVEDHPLEYWDFEGIIPKGQYGGGTVMLWDRGTWKSVAGNPRSALMRGHLDFILTGQRLQGKWSLIRIGRPFVGESKVNWLLIRKEDRAQSGPKQQVQATDQDRSVTTGRTMEEIAHDASRQWNASRNGRDTGVAKQRASKRHSRSKSSTRFLEAPMPAGAVMRARPAIIHPQLCTLVDRAPSGPEWLHEMKFDGYRFLLFKSRDKVRLISRNGKDWTGRFAPLAVESARLAAAAVILDGEACIVEASGLTSFQRLQGAIKEGHYDQLVFFTFDLLYLNGFDLRRCRLIDRKRVLESLLASSKAPRCRYSDHVLGDGPAVEDRACQMGAEGIVSKRLDSQYEESRTKNWLKVKCGQEQEFVIVGYTDPEGSRSQFGSLLLAAHDRNHRLIYAGRVGTGFDEKTLEEMGTRLKAMAIKQSPLTTPPPREDIRGAHWVAPRLVAQVRFSQWTEDGRLRHPVFKGLREDKKPKEVGIEIPKTMETAVKSTKSAPAALRSSKSKKVVSVVVDGIAVTHPDRVVYPEIGITKLQLVKYYADVAGYILPLIKERPLSTVRCPEGSGTPCFFQKHLGQTLSAPVRSVRVVEKDGPREYITIDSRAGLLTLIQFGVIELHPWGARNGDLEHPDLLTFDLDPGENVAFNAVKAGAMQICELLNELKLASFVKTSGGKGLHVVVPLNRGAGWDLAKEFCHLVASWFASHMPGEYTDTLSKAKRKGRIFVDYLRNGRGATSVAPYSARARPQAGVSMPIQWSEVEDLKSATQFTILNSAEHLSARKADPWRGFGSTRQQLTQAKLKRLM